MRFINRLKHIIFSTLLSLLIICGFYACASIGNPTGGAMDLDPPVMMRSNPLPDAVNFTGKKIELYFDEYIQLDKPAEKVIVTPPQTRMPIIKALGKRITVELQDSLIPNTTYTFDFTDAIADNNEKNAIEGFTFAFATGDVVDTLMISGILLNAEDLEPMKGILVGLHSNLADSAFLTQPFRRTSVTNERGQFRIRNVAEGEYRLYALQDMNRDYKFDQPGEAIAFFDDIIIPSFEPAIRPDTVWIDSLTIDTIKMVEYTRFTPDDIKMRLFQEVFEQQYFIKAERINQQQFSLAFNSYVGLPPEITLLDKDAADWYVMEYDEKEPNTLIYWIKDSLIYQQDTLRIAVDYLADDSLFNLVPKVDTLNLNLRRRGASDEGLKNADQRDNLLELKINATGIMDVYDTLKFTFAEPVVKFGKDDVQFSQKVDTLWQPREINILQDSLHPRVFYSDFKFAYGEEYRLKIDSAQVFGIYQSWNDSIETNFKIKKEEDYGHLYVMIHGSEGPGIGQLLDASDKVVRQVLLNKGELVFENLNPGKYYLRYIEDWNDNGKWDTGLYINNLQPEPVYYFESFFEIRQYGEIEHNWNIHAIPVEKQKPLEITKNKPTVKQPKKSDEENTNKQQDGNRNTPGGSRGRSTAGGGNRLRL